MARKTTKKTTKRRTKKATTKAAKLKAARAKAARTAKKKLGGKKATKKAAKDCAKKVNRRRKSIKSRRTGARTAKKCGYVMASRVSNPDQIQLPEDAVVYGNIGDIDPIEYGGGIVWGRNGDSEPLLVTFDRYGEGGDDFVLVRMVYLSPSLFDFMSESDWEEAARTHDYVMYEIKDMLTSPTPMSLALLADAVGSTYGWENLEADHDSMTFQEAKRFYEPLLDLPQARPLSNPRRARSRKANVFGMFSDAPGADFTQKWAARGLADAKKERKKSYGGEYKFSHLVERESFSSRKERKAAEKAYTKAFDGYLKAQGWSPPLFGDGAWTYHKASNPRRARRNPDGPALLVHLYSPTGEGMEETVRVTNEPLDMVFSDILGSLEGWTAEIVGAVNMPGYRVSHDSLDFGGNFSKNLHTAMLWQEDNLGSGIRVEDWDQPSSYDDVSEFGDYSNLEDLSEIYSDLGISTANPRRRNPWNDPRFLDAKYEYDFQRAKDAYRPGAPTQADRRRERWSEAGVSYAKRALRRKGHAGRGSSAFQTYARGREEFFTATKDEVKAAASAFSRAYEAYLKDNGWRQDPLTGDWLEGRRRR